MAEVDEAAGAQLISKRELLEVTGISYGQLYRWKRERLLPEEWFMKRSSYTGQETFFPREQVLERIAAIKERKESQSLEQIARDLGEDGNGYRLVLYKGQDLLASWVLGGDVPGDVQQRLAAVVEELTAAPDSDAGNLDTDDAKPGDKDKE
jgi:hypothetical protein